MITIALILLVTLLIALVAIFGASVILAFWPLILILAFGIIIDVRMMKRVFHKKEKKKEEES